MFHAYKLWSLWDMLQFRAHIFCPIMDQLQHWEFVTSLNIRDSLLKTPHSQTQQLSDTLINDIRENLKDYLLKFKTLKFSGASKQIQYILEEPIHIVGFYENIKALRSMIQKELEEQLFMFIPKNDAEWYNKNDVFGVMVSTSFPSAKNDIKESCNCYATGRYTASVFHLMRVLEHGLGALTEDIGLKFYRQSWGGIIKRIQDKIDDEIAALNKMPKDPGRTERLTFLSQAAKEFVYFKDGWRNYAMHGLEEYDAPKALGILNHVKAFMIHLSTKLSE